MKPKVVHITSVHSGQDVRIFIKECSSLAKAGYKVHLIAPNVETEVHIESGVSFHGISKEHPRLLRMSKTGWKVYKAAKNIDAELYHFHDPELIPVGLLLKAQGKKVIYDIHEDVPRQILSKEYLPQQSRLLISQIVEIIENIAAQKFDAVIAATPFIQKRFSDLGCYAVTVNNYPIITELYAEHLDWSKKQCSVCYVGGIGKIRGIFQMVEAIGQTDASLLLAGDFSSSSDRQQAIQLRGWKNTQELGQLNRTELAQMLARVMAGLVLFHPVPNHINAQPNKMFEYMSAGIPVIASNFPLWKEIVEGNNCGICVDPLDSKAIAKAIQWMVNHPDEAQRMGNNGRQAILDKYNWQTQNKILISLYEKCLEQ